MSALKKADPWVIEPNDDLNAANIVKANKRVAAIMVQHGKGKVPIRKVCHRIGMSKFNRNSNLVYVQTGLAPRLKSQGFDPERAGNGIIIEHDDDVKRKANVQYNLDLCQGSDLYPQVKASEMDSETLASQHLTLTFRLFAEGRKSSFTGDVFVVPDDDTDFKYVMIHGHLYWVVGASIGEADARFLAEWKNTDQNQNSMLSFAEVIRNLQTACRAEFILAKQVRVASVVAKVSRESMVKIKPEALADGCKWVVGMGITSYVDEFLHWISHNLNPQELTTSLRWFADQTASMSENWPLLKLGIAVIHSSGESVEEQVRPQDDLFSVTKNV